MEILSPAKIKKLLKENKIRPQKKLGQNFLVSKSALASVLRAASLGPGDTVLEAGPGLGVMTRELARRVKKVIAVEKDEKMARMAMRELKSVKNVLLIRGDILEFSASELPKGYKIAANLPYRISSPFVRKFLAEKNGPSLMALLVQKEVAERMAAAPPRMRLLSAATQIYGTPKITARIPRGAFWPVPKVDSAVIRVVPRKKICAELAKKFFAVARAGFLHPRKQLINNLKEGLGITEKEIGIWLEKNGVRPNQRAETLGAEDWLNLAKSYKMRK